MDGDEIRNLLVDSPDGYIRVDHKPNLPNCCHPDVFGLNNLDMTLEIKSPYPDPKSMPVHYSVPKYYVLQILAYMKAPGLWNDLWHRIKVFLDKKRPAAKNWFKDISHEFNLRFDH